MNKKLLSTLLAIALLVPAVSYGAFAVGFNATSTTANIIYPNLVNGVLQAVGGNYFTGGFFNATSTTASSTFANGLNLTGGCFAVNNVCITAGGGGGSGTVSSGTQGQNAYYAANGTTVSGTSTLFISTDSKVGIGTVSPQNALEVSGTSAGATFGLLRLTNLGSATSTGTRLLFSTKDSGNFNLSSTIDSIATDITSAQGKTDLVFSATNVGSLVERMRILASGNVGIGSTTPLSQLTVQKTLTSETDYPALALSRDDNALSAGDSIGDIDFWANDASVDGPGIGSRIRGVSEGAAGRSYGLSLWTRSGDLGTPISEKVRVTSTGLVGIGTTTPVAELEVAGTAPEIQISNTNTSVSAGGTYGDLNFYSSDTTAQGIMGRIRSKTNDQNVGGDGDLGFWTYQGGTLSEKMRLSAVGRLGIGTTTPSAFVQITNTSSVPSFLVEDSASVDSTPFIIDTVGDVGIGTTTPDLAKTIIESSSNILSVLGLSNTSNTANSRTYLNFYDNTAENSAAIGSAREASATDWGLIFRTGSGSSSSGPNDRMYISSTGNVGIGTTSPVRLLSLEGSGGGFVRIQRNDSPSANGVIEFTGNDGGVDGSISYNNRVGTALTFETGGPTNTRMTIDGSGNVGIGTTSPQRVLHVYNASNPTFVLESGTASANQRSRYLSVATGAMTFGKFSDAFSNTEHMRLDTDGNLGIGTTSPYARLSVAGGIVAGTINATSTAATSTFQGNIVISPDGQNPYGFAAGPLVMEGSLAGPYQQIIANTLDSSVSLAGLTIGNSKFRNPGFSADYYCGFYMAAPSYNLAGLNGVMPNGGALFCKDGPITIGSATSTAGPEIRFQATGMDSANVDAVIEGSTGNFGIGTTSPYAKLSIHPLAIDTQRTLFAIASSTATATTTLLEVDNIGNFLLGTSTKLAKVNIAAQTGVAMIVDGGGAGVDIAQFNRGIGANASVAISGGGSLPQVKFGNGGVYFNSMFYDANTGTFKISTTSTNISTQAEPFTIRNSNSFIGISSTTPSGRLSIGGGYDTTSSYVNINPAGTGTNRYMTITGTAIDVTTSNTGSPNSLLLQTAAGNNGSVGVGTTSPSGKFAVAYDIGSTDKREFYALNGRGLTSRYDDNSTANMRLQNFASIASSTFGSSIQFDLSSQAAGVVTQTNAGFISMIRTQDWSDTSTTNTSALLFATRNGAGGVAERVRISPAGNLGIATSSPTSPLSVTGSALISATTTSSGFDLRGGCYARNGACITDKKTFTYSTTTAWTGTTTIPLGTAFEAERWVGMQCYTDTGTVWVSATDGTNDMNYLQASTTVGTVTLTTNTTFTAAEKRSIKIGNPASSPTSVSCTASIQL